MSVCPKCKDVLSDGARACACGWRLDGDRKEKTINPECPWNDHGIRCNRLGSMADSTNGTGPWYCPEHFWKLRGITVSSKPPKNDYRDRWYAERGLDYQGPILDDSGPLRCIAQAAGPLLARLEAGQLGPRQREPGDDDDEIHV